MRGDDAMILPAILVTSSLAARLFRFNVYSGILAVMPAMAFWFLLIILLNQVEESVLSGEKKAESILERTEEIDDLLQQ